MSQYKPSPKIVLGVIIALFFGVALFFRIALPYEQVFGGDWVKFTGVDAYYFMRQVDNLVQNFPHLISFDPYMRYPNGFDLGGQNFFVYLLSGIIWLFGLGSPSQHTVNVVAVYFPAILGAITVIPVYFIGKELFNRWAGVIAAGLIALLPGEILGRSILGHTDMDALQVLLTIVTMLFLILAIKASQQKELTFEHLKQREWAVVSKPLIYSLLTGIFLGIYLLAWKGAFIFVFIIFIYFVTQFIINYLKHKSSDYLCFVSVILFLVALSISLIAYPGMLYLASLVLVLIILPILASISRLMASRKVKPVYYLLAVVGLGLVGLAIWHIVNPRLLSLILSAFSIFSPTSVRLTTMEMKPLLFPHGTFSLSLAWNYFTTGFFLSLISLGILIYIVIRQGNAEKSLLVVWSLVILAASLGQCRFALFYALNVALLTGYLSSQVLKFTGLKEEPSKLLKITEKTRKKKVKPKKHRKSGFRITRRQINMALAIIVLFFLVFFPNITPAIANAKWVRFFPSDAWCNSLSWLKENTPDPFGKPDFYYDLYEKPFHYPETAYGIIAWWDSGYWIIRIGHRLPNCDPGGGARKVVGSFFISQDEASASKIVKNLKSKYIIIDNAMVTNKFYPMITYAGGSQEEYCDIYYRQQGDRLVPVLFYHPEYYRSLAARLYNFDGSRVTPQSTTVISYQERVSDEGVHYKEITSSRSFPTDKEATAYISKQTSGNYRIVGINPFISPVPIEALEHYKLIHSSHGCIEQPGVGMIPEVKIFEYVGD